MKIEYNHIDNSFESMKDFACIAYNKKYIMKKGKFGIKFNLFKLVLFVISISIFILSYFILNNIFINVLLPFCCLYIAGFLIILLSILSVKKNFKNKKSGVLEINKDTMIDSSQGLDVIIENKNLKYLVICKKNLFYLIDNEDIVIIIPKDVIDKVLEAHNKYLKDVKIIYM